MKSMFLGVLLLLGVAGCSPTPITEETKQTNLPAEVTANLPKETQAALALAAKSARSF